MEEGLNGEIIQTQDIFPKDLEIPKRPTIVNIMEDSSIELFKN